ncbi:MlaD family protein [Amycolatopsis sp.]|uniref:MlaD family protein n=1 Tax=Amycolatopsis sp. TaxID=37632 RepID=UPI002C1AF9C6|nr:MlaD family protein [Amycolatopsis sp.]HVV11264.1 MlaD family protein [Amycolatopsis sp.]
MAAKLRKPVVLGAVLLLLVVGALLAVYQKERIGTMLSSGDTITAEFARDYRLLPDKSEVKMAGVVVGTVTDVGKNGQGDSLVSMKVQDGTLGKLGATPSAIIRPTTLLGGNYYVELVPGGERKPFDNGQPIPVARTSVPVELDQILAALPGRARQSVQDTTRLADQTLAAGAGSAAGDLLHDAPGALAPADDVLSALQGTRPRQDLYQLVPDLDSAAGVMTRQEGQLADVIDTLKDVSGSLAAERGPLAATVADLPATLAATRTGLGALSGSLDRVTAVAGKARPAVQELAPLLQKANPVVQQARPLVQDLRPLLHKALPLVNELVPTAGQATATLDNLRGPVLDRVNGPIATTILTPWTGSGAYAGDGGNGHRFYEELGYLAAHTANLSQYGDKNGRMLGLALGVGLSSVGGNDPGTAQLLQSLGLLPGGGVQILPPPDNSGDTYSPEPATAPGKDHVLSGVLPPLPLPTN